ncbi:MAG: CHAT domain-containing protein, partial [Cyclobacteriaceae bacterium]|nr:CHAT domain-containing protein [Cyclobacteriaceae bacterium]
GIYRNPSMEADVCRKLAYAYSTQNKYSDSRAYLLQALGIDSALTTNQLETIEDFRQLGLVETYLGNYADAENNLRRSLHLNEGMESSAKNTHKRSAADTHLALAQLHLTLGNYGKAGEMADKALDIYQEVPGEYAGMTEALLTRGMIATDDGDLVTGMEMIRKSAQIAEENGMRTARQNQALANAFTQAGDLETALKHMLLSLEEAEKTNIIPQIIWSAIGVGDMYNKTGLPERAREYYEKARRLQVETGQEGGMSASLEVRTGDLQKAYTFFEQGGALIGAARASIGLADYHAGKGRMDSAEYYLDQAGEFYTRAETPEGQAEVLLEKTALFIEMKNDAKAEMALAEVKKRTVIPQDEWRLALYQGQLHEREGRLDSASHYYLISISLVESIRAKMRVDELKSAYLNDKLRPYERLVSMQLEDNTEMAFNLSERARSRTFLDMLGNEHIAAKQTADVAYVARERELRLKTARLQAELGKVTLSRGARTGLQREVLQAQREHEEALLRLKLQDDAYGMALDVIPPPTAEIRAVIPSGEVMLEYWVSRDQTIIWILDRKSIRAIRVEVTRQELERLVRGVRNGIQYRDEQATATFLQTLSDKLIAPVGRLLKSYKRITIVPHKTLHFLPFHALPWEKGFFNDQFAISYAPSAAVYHYVHQQEETQQGWLAMALGNLSLSGFSALPGTLEEAAFIAEKARGATVRVSEAATESFFKENAPQFGNIHLATHGVMNDINPMYSYVLLNST